MGSVLIEDVDGDVDDTRSRRTPLGVGNTSTRHVRQEKLRRKEENRDESKRKEI